MGLSDIAGLVTNDPKTNERIVFLLNLLGKKQLSLSHILENVDYSERYLRFLITKLRGIRLLMGERRENEYYYYLSYESFTTYLKTKYSDAIYNLVKRG
jgi:DNA-binding transcriptional regulator PaaX